ncbi:MAG: hypothetical protein ACXWP5_05130 [Bdellovibrionota bacterium]
MPFRRLEKILLAAAAAGTLAVCALYVWCWEIGYSSDYAMIGLLAKRIIEHGESSVYLFTVNYQGMLLEGNALAALFRIFGIGPHVLSLANALFYLALVYFFYQAMRRFSGRIAAAWAVLLFGVGSPFFCGLVLRPQPNYTETFLFGCAMLALYHSLLRKLVVEKHDPGAKELLQAAALGALAGFGYYTYAQILYFIAAILIHYLLVYARDLRTRGKLAKLVFFPSGATIGLPLELVTLACLGLGAIGFMLPARLRDFLPQAVSSNPLKAILIGGILSGILHFTVSSVRRSARWRQRALVAGSLLLGLLAGVSPKIYARYSLAIPYSSRVVIGGDLNALSLRFHFAWEAMLKLMNVLTPIPLALRIFLGVPMLAALLWFLLASLRDGLRFVRGQIPLERILKLSPFAVLFFIALGGFLSSELVNSEAQERYFAIYLLVYAGAMGWALAHLIESRRPLFRKGAAVFAMFALALNLYAFAVEYRSAPKPFPQLEIADWLKSEGTEAGYSDYWYAYSIVFLTQEAVRLQPVRDAYIPYYDHEAQTARRIAYIDHAPLRSPGETMTVAERHYRILKRRNFGPVDALILERVEERM